MDNYFLPTLTTYFEEILQIERKFFISDSFLNNFRTKLKKENSENRTLLAIITSYRDISAIDSKSNLFIPDFDYSLDVNSLDGDIDDVVSHLSCLAVSQAYEIFEMYLINIITEFIYHNQEFLKKLKWADVEFPMLKSQIRELTKLNKGINNKTLLRALKKISGYYRQFEKNNIYKLDIGIWFDLISQVRHIIIHNRQIMTESFLEYLDTQRAKEIFAQQFQRKKIDKNVHIYLTNNSCRDIICQLNSFAHFIFLSLSEEKKLPAAVPQYEKS